MTALLTRLARLDVSTISDADKTLRVLPPQLRPISAGRRLCGRAVTVDADDDLLSVIGGLQLAGEGDVLVVATGGSPNAAAGEIFATEAARRGLAGIVIDGFCRDTEAIAAMTLPFYARGATPRASGAGKEPRVNVPILIGEIAVNPGDLIVGDADGLLVGTEAELAAALETAERIQQTETDLLAQLESGRSLFEMLNYDTHVEALRAGTPSRLTFEL